MVFQSTGAPNVTRVFLRGLYTPQNGLWGGPRRALPVFMWLSFWENWQNCWSVTSYKEVPDYSLALGGKKLIIVQVIELLSKWQQKAHIITAMIDDGYTCPVYSNNLNCAHLPMTMGVPLIWTVNQTLQVKHRSEMFKHFKTTLSGQWNSGKILHLHI